MQSTVMQKQKSVGREVYASLVLAQLIWSLMHLSVSPALREGVDALAISAMREAVAVPCLAVPTLLKEKSAKNLMKSLTWRPLGLSLICGLFTGLARLTVVQGVKLAGPTIAAAIMPTSPVVAFGLCLMAGAEKLQLGTKHGALQVIGLIVSVTAASMIAVMPGGPLVFGAPHDASSTTEHLPNNIPLGVLVLVANTVAASANTIIQRSVLQDLSLSVTITLQTVFSLMWQLLLAFTVLPWSSWRMDWKVAIAVLYTGIFPTAVNNLIMANANQHVSPTVLYAFMPLQPVFTGVLDLLIFYDPVYLSSFICSGGIFLGLALYIKGKALDSSPQSDMHEGAVANVIDLELLQIDEKGLWDENDDDDEDMMDSALLLAEYRDA
ncbi:hypothetical protein CYMTET_9433 [Cymbomonas tetramitiformis]|uniref:WAT1-related protein n=1 Tax=Cymbomonas tetramitiformis TaxID=36881 RepID=A0AAE0GRS9_9CHLO|nr:hypothetical protein CYMTET_9433 [Cymbomonas tetramitiformis]